MRRVFLLAVLLAVGNATSAAADPPDPPLCNDGVDNDDDGATDYPADPECASADDEAEAPACSDGADNDGDNATDYPADPHCTDSGDDNEVDPEAPACSNGVDDDGDGRADYPHDTGCTGRGDPFEEGTCQLANPLGPTGAVSADCFEEAPCADVFPPLLLHAEWTDQGILLAWQTPLTGAEPTAYVIYRVPDGRHGLLKGAPDPLDAVPATETSYLDATAQADRAYLYWLTSSAGTGCESAMSAPAGSGKGLPDHAKCLYVHKETLEVTGPSTNCLDG